MDNIDPNITRAQAKVMSRAELIKRLVSRLHKREAVIGGIGYTNFDLFGSGDRPENFYMLGSMGLAVPIAHGVALAQPTRRTFALEGDGSILMYLGCLTTVAERNPENLIIIILDNGAYQITGGQPTTTSSVADIVAIAKGCGLKQSFRAGNGYSCLRTRIFSPGKIKSRHGRRLCNICGAWIYC